MNTPPSETTPSSDPEAQQACRQVRRLASSPALREVYARKRRWVGRYMVLWVSANEEPSVRLAVVASRKVGHAVQRNRAKRRLREAWRTSGPACDVPLDIVLVARRAILDAPWKALIEELCLLTRRAGWHASGRYAGK